jgi:hypothetical protein
MDETDNLENSDNTIIKDNDYMSKTEDKIEKSAEEKLVELQKALDEKEAALKEATSGIEKAKKEVGDKEKAAEEKEKEAAKKLAEAEEMEKSVSEVKKEMESKTKEALDRVAKMEDINKSVAVKAKVEKSMGSIAGVKIDELASVIKVLDERQLTKEEISILEKALVASSAIIEKSALFKELGSSRGEEPNDPQSQCDAYVNSLVSKADHPMSSDEKRAMAAAFWDDHPDVYKAYLQGGRS